MTTAVDTDRSLEDLGVMLRIREFESRLPDLAARGEIRGSTHPAVGMEAVAVGVSRGLRREDLIASTHRGHAHCIAKGADLTLLAAEIMGRAGGYCGGKGGSMHVASRELGILGTNGVVGASIGIATGAALALQQQARGDVAVSYFGDGAINQGVFSESLNIAALWKLPIVFVCENNGFAQSSRFADMNAQTDITLRALALGVPGTEVDGMDVEAVALGAEQAILRAREGGGPSLIIANTYRYGGHMAGDTEIYREQQEVEEWRRRDPIDGVIRSLLDAGVEDVEIDGLKTEAENEVDEAFSAALAMPAPVAAIHDREDA